MKNILFTFLLIAPFFSNAQWTQMGLDIDGEAAGDESGLSVSMNAAGDRMAIGATDNDGNGNASGHVRIYEWDSTAWVQLGLDIDGEAIDDQSGTSVSMNAKGDKVAIGAWLNDGNGTEAGHVRIYEWDSTAWVQLGGDIDGEASGDASSAVSMNSAGDRLAIGAFRNGGNGINSGHVRIYKWDTSSVAWTQLGADIDGEAAGDLASSVSMNSAGDRLAIGAPRNGGNGLFSGHVRIYEWDSTAWVQLGSDIDGEAAGDQSGQSVSMNSVGDRLAIGALLNGGNGNASGHVRIYEWDSTAWVQMGADIDGESAGDFSGFPISMNDLGDQLAIGASLNGGNGSSSGHVRVYEWNGTAWAQLGIDIDGEATFDESGIAVSMNGNGDQLAIGAYLNDGNGSNSGHVRAYEFLPCIITASISNQTNVTCIGGSNGSITVSVDSGTANYNYNWSDSSMTLNVSDTFNTINGLVAGQYFVTITDTNRCAVIDSATITVLDTIGSRRDTLIASACINYTWIQNNQLYSSSGFYTDTSLNTLGCDSIYHLLDLTIINIDTTVAQINNLNLSSNDTLASYQWIDCNNGNSPIIGDTNRIFTATSNGAYAVALSNNGCADTSACIQILTVGLDDASIQESLINIYPNPNNGSFTISVSEDCLAKTYQILDVKGSLVKEGQFTNQTSTIDLSAFGKGIYYLQIREEGIRKKIVVY